MNIAPRMRELEDLDKVIFELAYQHIDESDANRVTGSAIWNDFRITGLAPFYVPTRLRRLISLGLIEKDIANSSSRTKVYKPTDAGFVIWQGMKSR